MVGAEVVGAEVVILLQGSAEELLWGCEWSAGKFEQSMGALVCAASSEWYVAWAVVFGRPIVPMDCSCLVSLHNCSIVDSEQSLNCAVKLVCRLGLNLDKLLLLQAAALEPSPRKQPPHWQSSIVAR